MGFGEAARGRRRLGRRTGASLFSGTDHTAERSGRIPRLTRVHGDVRSTAARHDRLHDVGSACGRDCRGLEVAPHATYTTDVTFARGPSSISGSAWESWPLAVQQLVFDSMEDEFTQARRGDLDANYLAAEQIRELGGSFSEMDSEAQSALLDASQGIVEDATAEGHLPEGTADAIPAAVEGAERERRGDGLRGPRHLRGLRRVVPDG